ncbi:hypothetical protein U6A24_05835 [Aquimarina gracilis]|uniref:Natural product n=1 Tax=Aquimarina gracilis TaxID=874422 RepID=A0ABU5ZUP6_9FLAO|nr:hypothetical protein [Aquimarina gracilis]MEB3344971.1 hypothetical protein [Aquimarina gracilis]
MKKSRNQNQGQKKLALKKLKITKLNNLICIKGGANDHINNVATTDTTDTFC